MSEKVELSRREVHPGIGAAAAVWQSEDAKTYRCPTCLAWIFSQYEGEKLPRVTCNGHMGGHVLEWYS